MDIRRSLCRRPVGSLLAGASLFLAGCSFVPEHLERESRTLQVGHVPASSLKVRTENGHVDARGAEPAPGGSPDQVTIQADLRARTLERLAQTKVLATREPDGVLSVRVEWPEGGRLGSEGCDFDIRVPDARGVDIQSTNGAVRVANLGGAAALRTSNGNITVETQGGAVEAHTSNGAVRLNRVAGGATVESSNGSIAIQGVLGAVHARSSNGSIDVRLDPEAAGPVSMRSSNGNARLVAGKAFRGRVEMETSNGGVHVNAGPSVRTVSKSKHAAVVVVREEGGDAQGSSIRTSNGSVDVEFQGD